MEYQQALKTQPNFPAAHYYLGRAFAQRGELDDAIAEYRKALETQPDFAADIHRAWGLALAARGQSDEAATHYRQARAIEANPVEARYGHDAVPGTLHSQR